MRVDTKFEHVRSLYPLFVRGHRQSGNRVETKRKHVRTSHRPISLGGHHLMPGKPYQSILIPYENEILTLRRQRPPVAFARIAELLREKHQVSIQRAAICKFVKVRARWKRTEARETRAAARILSTSVARPHYPTVGPRNVAAQPSSQGIEHRRPWVGWQKEKPASTGGMLTTFTPSNKYNLTRLTPGRGGCLRRTIETRKRKERRITMSTGESTSAVVLWPRWSLPSC